MPASKIDALLAAFAELSGKLGAFGEAIENLETRAAEDRRRADEDRAAREREHRENQRAIGGLADRTQAAISELKQTASKRWIQTSNELAAVRRDLKVHADAVSTMQAVRGSMPKLSPRIAFYASVGFGVCVLVAWVLEAAIKSGVAYLFAHLKFGG